MLRRVSAEPSRADACPRCGQPLPAGRQLLSRTAARRWRCRRPPSAGWSRWSSPTSRARPSWRRTLDPERFREVLAAFHGMVTDEVTALGGRAEGFIGDAVLGRVRRARRCTTTTRCVACEPAWRSWTGPSALGARLGLPMPVEVRVGVNTGQVAVGTADRPQHRDRRRGEHRRPPAAGGRSGRGPGGRVHAAAGGQRRASSARCRSVRGEGVRRGDGRRGRPWRWPGRPPAGRCTW